MSIEINHPFRVGKSLPASSNFVLIGHEILNPRLQKIIYALQLILSFGSSIANTRSQLCHHMIISNSF